MQINELFTSKMKVNKLSNDSIVVIRIYFESTRQKWFVLAKMSNLYGHVSIESIRIRYDIR